MFTNMFFITPYNNFQFPVLQQYSNLLPWLLYDSPVADSTGSKRDITNPLPSRKTPGTSQATSSSAKSVARDLLRKKKLLTY